MQEAIPNAILKVIPEADHGVPFKDPALFLSYIKDFLST
jgi:pimeloyl-ACP methyl ester carboxylesterase